MKAYYIKKAAALLLAFLLISACSFAGVSAQEVAEAPTDAEYSQQYPKAYEAIIRGIENLETEIDLTEANIPFENTNEKSIVSYIFKEVIDENPQFFYINKSYSYKHNYSVIKSLTVSYTADNESINKIRSDFEEASQRFLSLVNDEMTDYEKALVLHDAIAINCEYDVADTIGTNSYNAYGVLCDGKAVCQGYAYAYKYLLDRIGIENHIVSSDIMKHAWNIVKIGDSFYHVDLTMDDPVYDKIGRADHKYFLLSDGYIQNNTEKGFLKHVGYSSDYKATSDKFDNYFWKNVSSAFNYSDGYWYYSDTDGFIYKGTTDNMQETVLATVTDNWRLGNTTKLFSDKYVQTVLADGYLYYNTPDRLYRVNLQDNSDSQVIYTNKSDSEQFFGIAKKLDNAIYTSYVADYNSTDNSVRLFEVQTKDTLPLHESTVFETVPTIDKDESDTNLDDFDISLGDINGDGKINIKDATMIQMQLASLISLDNAQMNAADVTGDGNVKINDATNIQKYVAGLITEFTNKG